MNKSLFFAAFLSASLAACGGGGASVPDNSQAISDALHNINIPGVPSTPAAPFTGAFLAVNGVAVGWVAGKDPYDAVSAAVTPVIDHPSTYPDLYKLLLSDAGLKVVVYGKITGTSPLGVVQHEPDVTYTAKLMADGLHIVQGG
jgi:hypothetical protein